jgi:hypothetical protein
MKFEDKVYLVALPIILLIVAFGIKNGIETDRKWKTMLEGFRQLSYEQQSRIIANYHPPMMMVLTRR